MTTTLKIPEKPITLIQAAQLLAQAVSPENADAVRWSLIELLAAALDGTLRGRNPLTLAPVDVAGIPPFEYANFMVLTSDDLRQLASMRSLRVNDQARSEQRQEIRWQACVNAGLHMPTNTFSHFPRGIGKVAEKLGIERQSLTDDLNAYRERVFRK